MLCLLCFGVCWFVSNFIWTCTAQLPLYTSKQRGELLSKVLANKVHPVTRQLAAYIAEKGYLQDLTKVSFVRLFTPLCCTFISQQSLICVLRRAIMGFSAASEQISEYVTALAKDDRKEVDCIITTAEVCQHWPSLAFCCLACVYSPMAVAFCDAGSCSHVVLHVNLPDDDAVLLSLRYRN